MDKNRSRAEQIERDLEDYVTRTVPALDIEAYAAAVYEANRSAGL